MAVFVQACMPGQHRAEVLSSFITMTVWEESQVTPQGCVLGQALVCAGAIIQIQVL